MEGFGRAVGETVGRGLGDGCVRDYLGSFANGVAKSEGEGEGRGRGRGVFRLPVEESESPFDSAWVAVSGILLFLPYMFISHSDCSKESTLPPLYTQLHSFYPRS